MDKNEMLKILLDKLESMTDDEVIKHYEKDGIRVTNYEPGSIGKVCLYDYEDGTITGDICFSDICSIINNSNLTVFEFGEGVS